MRDKLNDEADRIQMQIEKLAFSSSKAKRIQQKKEQEILDDAANAEAEDDKLRHEQEVKAAAATPAEAARLRIQQQKEIAFAGAKLAAMAAEADADAMAELDDELDVLDEADAMLDEMIALEKETLEEEAAANAE